MPRPLSIDEALQDHRAREAQKQLEFVQQRARDTFEAERRRTEALTRRDLRGWARRNSKDGKIRGDADVAGASAIANDRMQELLARISGGRWPPKPGPTRDRQQGLTGFAGQAVFVVDQWKEKSGLDALDAAEYLDSDEAEAVFEDHRRNPVGVKERETRQLTESIARFRAGGADVDDVDRALDDWQVNAGIFELSTDAHVLAYARNYLGQIGEDIGAQRYVGLVSDDLAEELDTEGRTASVLYRTFDEDGLDELFRSVNAGRRTFTSWKTLGLGHGTHEVFWPIQPGTEGAMEEYYAAERSAFLDSATSPAKVTAAGVARDLEAFRRNLASELASKESDLSPSDRSKLLDRLVELLQDLRAGTL